jgi:hypothetical protein
MRRLIRRSALAAMLAVALPADAGMRATYHGETEPRVLIVEVADNGDARIGPPDSPSYGLDIGGTYHLVAPGADGKPEVMRVADAAAVLGKTLPPFFAELFTAAARQRPATRPTMTRTGTRTVAGFQGKVWKVTPEGQPAQEFVLSKDPALQPIGRAMGGFIEAMMVMATPMLGAMAGDMVKEVRGVFAAGTPLESVGRFRLVAAEAAAIAPERVALPAPPLSQAEIEGRLVLKPIE